MKNFTIQRIDHIVMRVKDIERSPCGSELARDGGVSASRLVDCESAIASKLAPAGGWRPA
jgi:hypothetical protein